MQFLTNLDTSVYGLFVEEKKNIGHDHKINAEELF